MHSAQSIRTCDGSNQILALITALDLWCRAFLASWWDEEETRLAYQSCVCKIQPSFTHGTQLAFESKVCV